MVQRVAILTAGGFAPCLSSAVGGLIERYSQVAPEAEIIAYRHGYEGLLKADRLTVTPVVRAKAELLHRFGGSPIGNSRVKLTNVDNLVKRGLVREGQNPLQVAADRLRADGVDILHTIGGDDTNTTAADLAAYLAQQGHGLTVVGLPKTIDNDIVPVRQSLGADTAAEAAAGFARHVVAEHNSAADTLIVHEVMGRHCGWLTAAAARKYRSWVLAQDWLPEIGLSREAWDIHAIFVPEAEIDLEAESLRLRAIMERVGSVNVFLSEGAGVETIVAEMEAAGEAVPRDAFGHVQLDKVNPGTWFARHFAPRVSAAKVLVQKSGYYCRSAAANDFDRGLIAQMVELAVDSALAGVPGLIGQDDRDGVLKPIEFSRVAGGKPFDVTQAWYQDILRDIGQPRPLEIG
ncbi:MAG: pyrophosphate--fructose-6-phosphate 1-phosphotransferase [Propionibacteriaceae bacterium]|jgi:pyrophosphate--fructose-6-phosphate 1-phosphotransferase|nr:pyrophosphate--fructose-6-phosphate 1-phosphotransferase [Propionibacteriaceae bacterium]